MSKRPANGAPAGLRKDAQTLDSRTLDSQTLDAQLCFAVYSTAHAFNRAYKPVLEALNLTYPQYLVMLVLWEEDGLAVKELGDRLFLDSGTLTPLLKRLETAGLVTRVRNPADERLLQVTLTAKGRSMREQAAEIPVKMGCAIGRPDKDIQRLKVELLQVRDALNLRDALNTAATGAPE
jgi:MarR family transcriptional regulator, organic hydroperoxide resistance regulator